MVYIACAGIVSSKIRVVIKSLSQGTEAGGMSTTGSSRGGGGLSSLLARAGAAATEPPGVDVPATAAAGSRRSSMSHDISRHGSLVWESRLPSSQAGTSVVGRSWMRSSAVHQVGGIHVQLEG